MYSSSQMQVSEAIGLTERLEQTLKRSCISYHIYDKTVANPTTVNVDEALHIVSGS